jgi:PD-(D/E)XK nuclease superfamily
MHAHDTAIAPPFTWSYSRLKAYETCPHQFNETQILKNWPEEKSELQEYGDRVHLAMATSLRSGNPLPLEFKSFRPWIDHVNGIPGELLVEDQCRWAIDRDYVPTTWFSKKVWLRTVCDVIKVDLEPNYEIALVIDWKTGRSANVDDMQLTLMALMAFVQFPELKRVVAKFVWLKEDDETIQTIDRVEAPDHWAELLPRVEKMQQGVEAQEFPAIPNRLCRKWCPVKTCEYNGI